MVDRSIRYFPCTHLTCFIKLKELPHFVFTLTHFRMNINRFEKGTKRAPVTETEHRSAEELEKEGSATSTCQTPTRWRSSSVRSDLMMKTNPGSLSNTKVKKELISRLLVQYQWRIQDFPNGGGAVLSQMGGRTSCFQVKSA